MSVYVDSLVRCENPPMDLCRLYADSLGELQMFAHDIGLSEDFLQESPRAHYDLIASKRALAVRNGAIELLCKRQLSKFLNRPMRR